jgi:energy-coupling factor transport system permease protein
MRVAAAPTPALLVYGALVAVAFATNDPVVLLAVLAVSVLAIMRADAPRRVFLTAAAAAGLAITLINPLVTKQGDLVLINGPSTPILNFQITLEQVVYGAASGVRVAAVTLLFGAFLGSVDRDRLLAQTSRAAPRSALTVALAARLVPVLRRDATMISETARLRGVTLAGARGARRAVAVLLTPLAASALERGLDRAEAMTARGYGSGPRSALPERPLTGFEGAACVVGVLVLGVAFAAQTAAASFVYYPTLGSPQPAALVVAALTVTLGSGGVLLVGSRT